MMYYDSNLDQSVRDALEAQRDALEAANDLLAQEVAASYHRQKLLAVIAYRDAMQGTNTAEQYASYRANVNAARQQGFKEGFGL